MAIVNLRQRTPEWLSWRNEGITASMISVILGINPYMSRYRLWAELSGFKQPDDLSDNYHVQRGIEQEPEALKAVEAIHTQMFVPVCCEFDANTLFKASLDGLSLDYTTVTEIKCPCERIFNNIKQLKGQAKEYKMYYSQVQWQLMCIGCDVGYLFFYLRGQRPLQIKIKRNDAFIADAQKQALAFWDLVQSGTPPERIESDTECYEETLTADEAREFHALANRFIGLSEDQKRIKEELEALNAKVNTVKQQLSNMLPNGYTKLERNNVKVQRCTRLGKIDYKAIREFIIKNGIALDFEDFRAKDTVYTKVTSTGEIDIKEMKIEPEFEVENNVQDEATVEVETIVKPKEYDFDNVVSNHNAEPTIETIVTKRPNRYQRYAEATVRPADSFFSK